MRERLGRSARVSGTLSGSVWDGRRECPRLFSVCQREESHASGKLEHQAKDSPPTPKRVYLMTPKRVSLWHEAEFREKRRDSLRCQDGSVPGQWRRVPLPELPRRRLPMLTPTRADDGSCARWVTSRPPAVGTSPEGRGESARNRWRDIANWMVCRFSD